MGVLANVGNNDKQFWKLEFHATNEKVQHAFDELSFYLLNFEWARGMIFFSYLFPLSPQGNFIKFPKGWFSEMFSLQFNPKLFNHNSISMYIKCKGCQKEVILWSYFGNWSIFRFICLGTCPLFQKNSWWAKHLGFNTLNYGYLLGMKVNKYFKKWLGNNGMMLVSIFF